MEKKSNFAGAREWRDEFSFLAKTGLDTLYSMLLGMAQSKNDIRRFHGLLDANVRLLRPDLIKLENFWEKYISPQTKVASKKQVSPNDETLKWFFEIQCAKKNNTEYYFNYLFLKKGTSSVDLESYDPRLIVSNEEGAYYNNHFIADMFNKRFAVGCFLSGDKKLIIVCLGFHKYEMTEESAYEFSTMPGYLTRDGASDTILYFNIILSATEIVGALKEFFPKNCNKAYYLADEEFVGSVKKQLLDIEVPITYFFTPRNYNL